MVRLGLDEAGKRTHARKLNMARRHLNQEQRRSLVQAELKDRPQVSDRTIARELGVSNPTVSAIRKEMEEKGDVLKFNTSIDSLGRQQPRPTAKPISIPVAKPEQVAKVAAKAQTIIETAAPLNRLSPFRQYPRQAA